MRSHSSAKPELGDHLGRPSIGHPWFMEERAEPSGFPSRSSCAEKVGIRSRLCEALERERWTAHAELIRRALVGLMQPRSGIIVGAVC